MGAGCYYTNNETGDKAYWIDLDLRDPDDFDSMSEFEDEQRSDWEFTIEDVGRILESIGYDSHRKDPYKYSNGLGTVHLESTYYGDGLVIRLEPHSTGEQYEWLHHEDQRRYNLFMSNFDRMYAKIKRSLLSDGYTLRIATSGYTSTEITN